MRRRRRKRRERKQHVGRGTLCALCPSRADADTTFPFRAFQKRTELDGPKSQDTLISAHHLMSTRMLSYSKRHLQDIPTVMTGANLLLRVARLERQREVEQVPDFSLSFFSRLPERLRGIARLPPGRTAPPGQIATGPQRNISCN